ncbi:M48 family metallopeptidase [Halolamina sp. CBA1230]|uniref:M48 family metallopeptidase n=1 Tax=Halolamina sp. CBA1230 TaxID=1853690 RepID=UPI0009A24384|nr:SprT family zinc-dependent metalloprotease [Halolamina sp. CBA1230]QKY19617.1 M48 family metallopeptidase [Halolamina sp. CBA1230]
MSETAAREVDLSGTTVEYELRRSADATRPRIDVDLHGVTVVIPEGSRRRPGEFLREKASWVVEKHREFQRYRERVPDRTFESGASFPVLGTERELVVEPARRNELTDETIHLRRSAVEQSSVKRALESFYRSLAREQFTARADQFAPEMGVEYGGIEVRNQKTKWGSCSSNGTLGLNWRLMLAPPEIVDYIVVHELAHLREMNHGEAFWAIVEAFDPEWEQHREWLREHSAELVFSEDDL